MKKETEAEIMLMEDYGMTLEETRSCFIPEAMERFARKKAEQMQLLINIMGYDEKDGVYECDKCDDKKRVEVTDLDGVTTEMVCPFCHNKNSEPRTQYCNHFKCGKYFEMDKETFGNLQMIRNYFGKNDKTPFEHLAFEVIDEIIKTNTP